MAHKHIYVSGDKNLYDNFCTTAQDKLVTAVTSARGVTNPTPEQLKDLLLRNGNDIGDFYLGFKENHAHHAYLDKICPQICQRMAQGANTAISQKPPSPPTFKK